MNKLGMYKFKYIGIIAILNAVFAFAIIYYRMAKIRRYLMFEGCVVCATDMMEVGFNSERLLLIVLNAIVISVFMRKILRKNIIIQSKDRSDIIRVAIKKSLCGALVVSAIATATTALWSILLTDVTMTNWLSGDSYMQRVIALPREAQILSLLGSAIMFFVYMFVLLLLTGMMIIISCYIKSPIIGIVGIFLLMVAELSSSNPLVKLLFYNVKMDNAKYCYGNNNYITLIIIPIVFLAIELMVGMFIVKRKNYY